MKLFHSLLLTATLSLSAAANATIITFTDRDAFNAAVGSVNLIDFENFPDGHGVCPSPLPGDGPCSLTAGDVTFTARKEGHWDDEFPYGAQLVTTRSGFGNPSITLISSFIPTLPGDFTITFTGAAIGLDLISAGGSNWPFGFLFEEANGALSDQTLFSGFGEGRFFGAISDVGFSELSIFSRVVHDENTGSDGISNFYIDNVATAAPSAVPEPSTLALWVAGMGLLGWTARCRRPDCARAAG